MPFIPALVWASMERTVAHQRAHIDTLTAQLAEAGGTHARLLDAIERLDRLLGATHTERTVERAAVEAEEGPPLPPDLAAGILAIARPGTDMHTRAIAWARGRLAAGIAPATVKDEILRGGE